jgi:hypothetical protein
LTPAVHSQQVSVLSTLDQKRSVSATTLTRAPSCWCRVGWREAKE